MSSIKRVFIVFSILTVFLTGLTSYSQTIGNDISVDDINNMRSDDVQNLIQQAKANGYTPEQIKALAISKGLSPEQAQAIAGRIGVASSSPSDSTSGDKLSIQDKPNFNPDTSLRGPSKKGNLFGYDFFNNQNISFEPNINLATPSNYQLGPGDGLVISLWGAAENTYDVEVNRNGTIKIPNVGQVAISGLTIERAREKIRSKLLRIYRGITASTNSPYKIFTDISLSNVRTVQVNIIGEVNAPGTYSLSALSTVLNALYAAGGPTEQGTFREIKLVRGGETVANFDIYTYLTKGSQEGNLTLRDQDVIIVKPYVSRVKVNGKVKRPGTYELKKSEKFSDLLNFVSGFTSDAYTSSIKLDRIKGDRKVLKEIDLKDFRNEILYDGDVVSVGAIIDKYENRVTITGEVYRPGDYEYTSNMTFKQLLEKASGLTPSAYLGRMVVTSTIEGENPSVESYSLTEVLNGNKTITLQVNDDIQIFNKLSLSERGVISISGAVNNPTRFPFRDDLSLQEIVLLAGGYAKEADPNVIDVTREVVDDNFETISETFKIDTERGLDLKTNISFVFQPNDKIAVRYLKGSGQRVSVSIVGEVLYPGQYEIAIKGERILDVLEKSGGLSPYAFKKGGSLVRKNPFYKEVTQQLTTNKINDSTSTENVNIDLNNLEEYRVALDFESLIKKGASSRENMVLKNGDRIIIPSIKETVKIEGEVMLPSLVKFDKSLRFKDYISKSGGFNNKAKRGKAYVIYPNGDLAATKKFLFFKSYPPIEPGALVVVPSKRERQGGISTQEVLGLTTGFATLALLIERLFN